MDITCRYAKFFHSLRNSACKEIQIFSRLLARDVQSVTGKNLRYLQEASGLDPWTTGAMKLKEALKQNEVVDIPQQDQWRLPYLCSLLGQRREAHALALEEDEELLTGLIDSLVIN